VTIIDNLTNYANQTTTLVLPDNSTAQLTLLYNNTTQRWTWDLVYGSVNIEGQNLCCHPNILRQWLNVLPFGISCVTADQTDPLYVTDFFTGRVTLYLLTKADVQAIERNIFGQPASVGTA
jgi:hypothetical protein